MDLSLPLAFSVGLFSTLHCIGMCGGIAGALSYGLSAEVRQHMQRLLLFLLTYSTGRIISYTLAGVLMGSVGGRLSQLLGPGGEGHRWLQWFAAFILVLIGLHIAGWLPSLSRVERLGVPLWQRVEPLGRRLMPVQTLPKAFGYGFVWGWLPCGLVYTMLISSTARAGPVSGGLYMLAFGLGTLPAVLATGLLAGRLHRFARMPYLNQVVGVTIIAFGLLTIWSPELLESTSKKL